MYIVVLILKESTAHECEPVSREMLLAHSGTICFWQIAPDLNRTHSHIFTRLWISLVSCITKFSTQYFLRPTNIRWKYIF